MAEVNTSNSMPTPSSPVRAETKKENTDPFKPVGSLTFLIDNFREFSNSPPGKASSNRHCDDKVSVRGLTFGLSICPFRCESKKDPTQKEKFMGLFVKCENTSGCNANGDGSWSCLASVTLRCKNLLKPEADRINEYGHKFFSNKVESSLEWFVRVPFDYLLDPNDGPYNEKDDTVELVAKISVDAPEGILEMSKMDAIQVNEGTVFVNKNLLAAYSRYFHTMFYNKQYPEGQSGVYKVNIEAPATVEHFKRLLDTMYPQNKPLDDQCIEGVLHLANQFLVTDVEGKCLKFLTEKSEKPALFTYRVADKYGYTGLKNYVLDNLKATDFEKELLMPNIDEYNQLGSSAAKVFRARYNAKFPPKI